MDSLVKRIVDYSNGKVVNITLWTQKSLEAIRINSGELASSNEYQVHYWALHLEKTFKDGSKFCIQIPTVFYNYPQEVSSTTVDFNLADVEKISDETKELHNMKVQELLPILKQYFKDYEFKSVPLNTLHKHP